MPENWDQVKELFALALERDPEERSSFLRQACAGDDSLRTEIESLLSSFDGAATFLEDCPAADLVSAQPRVVTGRKIGAYRILREIGQGGMAVVYLGERDDQTYRKQVAIKMVKSGIDTEQVLHRFRNERQTLAALDHSNIVKLLDGGSSEDGSPYLVMEYVEGLPIDQYCDLHKLSIHDRLRLFREVCSAVQYAHENLVIHRDLKPGNILVSKSGVPRLLDFGIAKLLNPECFQTPLITRANWHPMTPEYASPEQIRGHAITAATDVYSLGVLLFDLLTSQRPYRSAGQSLLEIERLVCETEPEKPSAVVNRREEKPSDDGDARTAITPEWVSNQRGLQPAELQRRLRGDLDTIVMKALRKEPERRYGSVAEFSQDIERYLTGRPVRARKSTVAYRGGRFLHRHKESLAAALVVLGIVAGAAMWEVHRISRPSGAVPEARSARVPARHSVAILGFKNLSGRPDTAWLSTALSEILATDLAAGEELRTIPNEIVGRTKIDLRLPDAESIAPATLAKLSKNLGNDFAIFGSYLSSGKENGGQIRLDLRIQDAARGSTIATVSETGDEAQLLDLVTRTGARLRERLGLSKISPLESQEIRASVASNPEAIRLYSQGLSKIRTLDAQSARDLLTRAVAADVSYPLSHSALAAAWLTLGYDSKAQQEAKLALDASDKLSREDHLQVEGLYYETSKNWPKAIETYATLSNFFPDSVEYGLALARVQSSGGKGKDALSTLAALARVSAHAQDDPRIDLAISEAAAALEDDTLRRDSAERAAAKGDQQDAKLLVARARNSECRALANLGENEKAKTVCEEARRTFAEAGDRAGVARSLHSMAEVPLNQGDLVSAEKLYREALGILREVGDKRGTGSELLNLGLIYVKRGDFATGRKLYDESLESYRAAGDKTGIAMATGNAGMLLRAQGRLPEAIAHFQETLRLSNELGDRSSAALAFQAIGEVMAEKGDLAGAHAMYQQALAIQKEIGERSYYAATLVDEGKVHKEHAELDKARSTYQEALSIQQQLGEKNIAAETQLALADLDLDSGQIGDAEQLAREALGEFEAQKEPEQEIYAEATLSRSLLQQGKIGDANACMAKALILSAKSPDIFSRLSLTLDHAAILAATKDRLAAEKAARQVLSQTERLGLLRLHLEASLVLGEVQMQGRNPDMGRKRLEETGKAARSQGFELIARRADVERQAAKRQGNSD
jgi:serine/threonine protein kinase/tetratricopeptide (TPR) repeat protein